MAYRDVDDKDYTRDAEWFRKAAEQGDEKAQSILAEEPDRFHIRKHN